MVVVTARGTVPLVVLASLLSAPAAAAPPVDAFCVILIEGLDGFSGVRVLVDEETTLEERQELFPQVDADADGIVTRDEGDAWRRGNMQAFERGEGVPEVERIAMTAVVDGEERALDPLYAAIWRQVGHTFHKQDHEQPWPVAEPIDLETQEVRETRFPVEGATRVTLRGGLAPVSSSTTSSQSYTVTPEYVVVRASPGWSVARVEGSTYQTWMDQAYPNPTREVDLPAFDTKASFVLTFEPAQPAAATASGSGSGTSPLVPDRERDDGGRQLGIPAAPALAVLAVVALAALARRRL